MPLEIAVMGGGGRAWVDGFRGIVVDSGFAVDPVHSSTPNQPQSPDQPQ
jgi:hypothetical protein